jgi:hypothetical protein
MLHLLVPAISLPTNFSILSSLFFLFSARKEEKKNKKRWERKSGV